MAHLWTLDRNEGWTVSPLGEDRYALAGDPVGGVSPRAGRPAAVEPALIRAVDAAGHERWVLVSEICCGVQVNGQGVPGVRVLADKDEICGPQLGRLYFSTERLARVEPFAGPDDASCPRCARPLEPGDPAVRCPKCGVAHHEMDGWHCWTHAERCQLCDQPTRLDAGLRWSPEQL